MLNRVNIRFDIAPCSRFQRSPMSHNKPEPIHSRPEPSPCPVCGKVSYSAARIHPQCAARQADEKRKESFKQDKGGEKKAKKQSGAVSRWQKTCPECQLSQHVRKKVCTCGHSFAANARPPTDENGEP